MTEVLSEAASEQLFIETYMPLVEDLPFNAHAADLYRALRKHEVVLLTGPTGSGKSLGAPHVAQFDASGRTICLENTRLLCMNLADYSARAEGHPLSNPADPHRRVGFDVRHNEKKSPLPDGRDYVTTGKLLGYFKQTNGLLTNIDTIDVDEFDNRDMFTSVGMGLLAEVQRRRKAAGIPALRIILSTATVSQAEVDHLKQFFENIGEVEVAGRRYEIQEDYEKEYSIRNRDEIAKKCADRTVDLIKKGRSGGMMVVVPGEHEVIGTKRNLETSGISSRGYEVLTLYGEMADEEMDEVLRKLRGNPDKYVLVGTVGMVARGHTINNLHTIINSGFARRKRYDDKEDVEIWETIPQSQHDMTQIAGRVGRLKPLDDQIDLCHHMVSEDEAKTYPETTYPEIMHSKIEGMVLTLYDLGLNPLEFSFYDQIDKDKIVRAISILQKLGALDENRQITYEGKLMAKFPLEPNTSRSMIQALEIYKETKDTTRIDCLDDTAIMCACFGGRPIFRRLPPREDTSARAQDIRRKYQALQIEGSDFLTALNVFRQWEATGYDDQFIQDNYLSFRSMEEARLNRQQFLSILNDEMAHSGIRYRRVEVVPRYTPVNELNKRIKDYITKNEKSLEKCIVAGAADKVLEKQEKSYYKRLIDNKPNIRNGIRSAVLGGEYLVTDAVAYNETTQSYYTGNCHTIKDMALLYSIAPELFTEIEKRSSYQWDEVHGCTVKYGNVENRKANVSLKNVRIHMSVAEQAASMVDFFDKIQHESLQQLLQENQRRYEMLRELWIRSEGVDTPEPESPAAYMKRLLAEQSITHSDELISVIMSDHSQFLYPIEEELVTQQLLQYPSSYDIAGEQIPLSYTLVNKNTTIEATITLAQAIKMRDSQTPIPQVASRKKPGTMVPVEIKIKEGNSSLSSIRGNVAEAVKSAEGRYMFEVFSTTPLATFKFSAKPESTPAEIFPSPLRPVIYGKHPATGADLIAYPYLGSSGVAYRHSDEAARDYESASSRLTPYRTASHALPPVSLAELETYLETVQAELEDKKVAYYADKPSFSFDGATHTIRMTTPEKGGNTVEWKPVSYSVRRETNPRPATYYLTVTAQRPDGLKVDVKAYHTQNDREINEIRAALDAITGRREPVEAQELRSLIGQMQQQANTNEVPVQAEKPVQNEKPEWENASFWRSLRNKNASAIVAALAEQASDKKVTAETLRLARLALNERIKKIDLHAVAYEEEEQTRLRAEQKDDSELFPQLRLLMWSLEKAYSTPIQDLQEAFATEGVELEDLQNILGDIIYKKVIASSSNTEKIKRDDFMNYAISPQDYHDVLKAYDMEKLEAALSDLVARAFGESKEDLDILYEDDKEAIESYKSRFAEALRTLGHIPNEEEYKRIRENTL